MVRFRSAPVPGGGTPSQKKKTTESFSNFPKPIHGFQVRMTAVSFREGIEKTYPIASMYGIFTYIWLIFMVNVGKYAIHGWYGY